MDVFRGLDEQKFMVLSGHSMVYPIKLPPWLPLDICTEMVERFQKHLCSQLTTMVANHSNASDLRLVVEIAASLHHQNLSIESKYALSNASSTTDTSGQDIGEDMVGLVSLFLEWCRDNWQ
jgi:hypothetical protein